jgi:hypothetical protein
VNEKLSLFICNGQQRLERIADVELDGRLSPCEGQDKRKKIFMPSEMPVKAGHVGVWEWEDAEGKAIRAKSLADVRWIECIKLPKISSEGDLLKELATGLEFEFEKDHDYFLEIGKSLCAFCRASDFRVEDGRSYLAEKTFFLDLHEIKSEDVEMTGDPQTSRYYYKSLNRPQKQRVLAKTFVDAGKVNVINKIRSITGKPYFCDEDFAPEMLVRLIGYNALVSEKFKEAIVEKWESDSAEKFQAAKRELEDLQESYKNEEELLARLKAEVSKVLELISEKEKLAMEISALGEKREKLSKAILDLEGQVRDRISKAKENVGEFFAEYSVFSMLQQNSLETLAQEIAKAARAAAQEDLAQASAQADLAEAAATREAEDREVESRALEREEIARKAVEQAEERARKAEEQAASSEETARKAEEQAKSREEAARQAEEQVAVARRAVEKSLQREATACKAEEEALQREATARKAEEEALQREAAARKAEEQALSREEAARKAEEQALSREEAARKAEGQAVAREASLKGNWVRDTIEHRDFIYASGLQASSDPISIGDEVLGCLAENLEAIGVDKGRVYGLASFLLAARFLNANLILAGYGAVEIADALSATLVNKKADRCYIKGNDCIGMPGGNNVLAVFDAFGCMNKIAANSGRFVCFIAQTSEELMIEPRSVYNYALPVFVELFVTGVPNDEITGYVYKGTGFANKSARRRSPLPNGVLLPLARKRLDGVTSLAHGISKISEFDLILLSCVPVLASLSKKEKLEKIISDAQLSDNEKAELNALLGEMP